MMHEDEKVISASGATSSKLEGYEQLPYFAMRRLAQRYKLGEAKHGRDNWRKGLQDKPYLIERLGHVIHHALKAIAILEDHIEDDGDDNAGAIMWGGAFLAEALENLKVKVEPQGGLLKDILTTVQLDGLRTLLREESNLQSLGVRTNSQFCAREAAHDGPCNGLPTKSCPQI